MPLPTNDEKGAPNTPPPSASANEGKGEEGGGGGESVTDRYTAQTRAMYTRSLARGMAQRKVRVSISFPSGRLSNTHCRGVNKIIYVGGEGERGEGGEGVLSGGRDGTVREWGVPRGGEGLVQRGMYDGHNDWVNDLVWCGEDCFMSCSSGFFLFYFIFYFLFFLILSQTPPSNSGKEEVKD